MGDKRKKTFMFIRLVSAAGTGFFYVKRKSTKGLLEKLEFHLTRHRCIWSYALAPIRFYEHKYSRETTTLVTHVLKVWMNQFSLILEHPVKHEDPDDWSLRMEVLKCFSQLVNNFPFIVESELMAIMRPFWHTFESSLQVYLRSSIEGAEDSYDGRYDSDGEEKSLDTFVIQLFEFLSTIVTSRRLSKVIASNVRELVYQSIDFLQITEQQVGMNHASSPYSNMI